MVHECECVLSEDGPPGCTPRGTADKVGPHLAQSEAEGGQTADHQQAGEVSLGELTRSHRNLEQGEQYVFLED